MAFLTLGTLDVEVTEFRRLPDERGGGGLRRSLNGHLRGVSDWVKRAWAGELYAADQTELDAIMAVVDPDDEVAVSGDALPSITARLEITGDIRYVRTHTTWVFRVPVTIREA